MHPFFFKLLRILSRSRMLAQFSLTCIFHHVRKKINLWCSHWKMNWIYAYLLMSHFPTQNTRYNFLKIRFSKGPRTKWWRKLWFALLKFNQKIWRWYGTLVYLLYIYVVWFIILANVMALLFCELFLSSSVVLSLLLLLCNHGNSTLKLH